MPSEREINRFLQDRGFHFKRNSKTGEIWTDGRKNISVSPHACRGNFRAWRNTQAEVERAVKERNDANLLAANGHVVIPQPEEKEPALARLGDLIKPTIQTPIIVKRAETGETKTIAPSTPPSPTPEPTVPAPKKERRVFDELTRETIKLRIQELIDESENENITSGAIAGILNQEGFRMSNGDPMDRNYVGVVMHTLRQKDREPRPMPKPAAPAAKVQSAKVQAMLEARRPRLPRDLRQRVWTVVKEQWDRGERVQIRITEAVAAAGITHPDGYPLSRMVVGRMMDDLLAQEQLARKAKLIENKEEIAPPAPPEPKPAPVAAPVVAAPPPAPVAAAPVPAPVTKLPAFVLTILREPHLTDGQKVKMLLAYEAV